MFGTPAKVGLASAGIPHDEVNNVLSEEDIENVLKEMEGRSEEDETPNSEKEEDIENAKLNNNFEFDHEISETSAELQQSKICFIFSNT